jgi:hypothetical protein
LPIRKPHWHLASLEDVFPFMDFLNGRDPSLPKWNPQMGDMNAKRHKQMSSELASIRSTSFLLSKIRAQESFVRNWKLRPTKHLPSDLDF